MTAWYESLSGMETVFFISSVVGGVFFLAWLVMQFLGGDADTDLDTDVDTGGLDTDVDADAHPDVSGEADLSFKVLSFQGLSSFLTMFGLVGLSISRETDHGDFTALVGGVAAGLGMSWVLAQLFKLFNSFQSSGTLNMAEAVGQEGTVYLNIPPTGVGKVRISVQDHLKVFEAVSEGEVSLETGMRISVVKVIDGQTLVVKKAG